MVFDKARCVVGTLGAFARVYALIVTTGEIRRTPAVPEADRQGRTTVLHADASRLVVHHHAGFVLRAGGSSGSRGHTRVQAFAVDASHVRGATVISVTFPFLRSTDQLSVVVHDEAVLADANRPVPSGDTFLVRVTHVRGRYGARIVALAAGVTSQ